MRDQLIEGYWLDYEVANKQTNVWIRIIGSNWVKVAEVASSETIFLSDMLRNEKPHWDTNGRLHTREELTSEAE